MSSLVLTLRLDESETIVAQKYQLEAGKPKEQAKSLEQLFKALASGGTSASLDVHTGSDSPVHASGTFTLVSVIATDAITIGKTTFTFTSTPTLPTDVEVDGASDALDAAALAAAINANTTTNKIVLASAASNVVTVTARVPGVIGNYINISSADATITASATYLASGAGGVEDAGVTYSLGL